eukprot:CAMPEP_0181083050 /NCGR_PEP_ID=MMETSP1071-20121207/3952_1 /TAXON_ID=35127 /ORGANISM="Thalassiosira sp., Strain NH16" /LENGTH=470 /DNA_ID=CAMNT_0023164685 /DNA_START=109 /DNA_END=1518 /DNA_ORIENTATION=+
MIIAPLMITFSHSCQFGFAFSITRSATNDFNLVHHGHAKKRGQHHRSNGKYRLSDTMLLGHERERTYDSLDEHNDEANGVVSLTIRRELPNATPYEARNSWVEYHWNKGGGLPISILSKKQKHESNVDDDNKVVEWPNVDNYRGEKRVIERTILPILMKERGEYDEATPDAKSVDLHYKVTESGPFYSDIIPGSHHASVTFNSMDSGETVCSGCFMTWNVTFATTRWSSFYKAMTKWTVGTAATTVQEASSTPRLFSMTTTIDGSVHAIDPVFAQRECLEFVFAEGGGLPLPPPIPYGSALEVGRSARRNVLRIPPIITESIVDTKTSDEMAEFTYRLNDPGWLTFPFLLHTHLGRVRFTSNASSHLVIDWDVEIRPYRIASPMIEKLVDMTVSTVLRNIRIRLTEQDAEVVVRPSQGNVNFLVGRTSLAAVAKDTWLGGVLDAHLSDTRSTTEQTLSLLRPWSWGRSGK